VKQDIPNPHVRDFQRKKLYAAEESCSFWPDWIVELTEENARAYINSISTMYKIKEPTLYTEDITTPHGIRQRISKQNGDMLRLMAYATPTYVAIPSNLLSKLPYIVHEMSHVINYQLGPTDHHGPNFASIYLKVLSNYVGSKESKELQDAFDLHKVKYNV
tara:strand:- start:269 stop:751 length:483 start_codon:yes stop_codon:yes gene_type:complete